MSGWACYLGLVAGVLKSRGLKRQLQHFCSWGPSSSTLLLQHVQHRSALPAITGKATYLDSCRYLMCQST